MKMPEAVATTMQCETCGVERRPGTAFCYNCGSRLETLDNVNGDESEISAATREVLDEIADRIDRERTEEERLAQAASERKQARFKQRRTHEVVWEPTDGPASRLFLLIAVMVAVAAAAAVFITVLWR